MNHRFRSSGKLLLSGEYVILDGALGLAVPTAKGQTMVVSPSGEPGVNWTSRDCRGETWFSTYIAWAEINEPGPRVQEATVRNRLLKLLREAKKLNEDFLNGSQGFAVETILEFPRNWGLGTSSTLISNLAGWSGTDAFELQRRTFGGSGYDIACASRLKPILYQKTGEVRRVTEIEFSPSFASSLYFIHLNRKQDSGEAIASYRNLHKPDRKLIDRVTEITLKMAEAKDLDSFERLLWEHERLLSGVLGQPTLKEAVFPDYNGSIKSLGAWGGDFILVTGTPETIGYFEKKGYDTVVPYMAMVA
jgi:mevalonate kinase